MPATGTYANAPRRIVALAGGVGGAKLAQGLALAHPDADLTVIVNTGDDFTLDGLRICPDLDTVLYTLGGIANPVQGWGIAGDTFVVREAMQRLGDQPWFLLGDRDYATHILRTSRLAAGQPLSRVTADFAAALGVGARILPVTDNPIATKLETPDGVLDFQEYFVARRQEDEVTRVILDGIESARPAPGVLDAIAAADLIVMCPSNPFVSIGPVLAVPGVRAALVAAAAPVVGVSPIVGGKAIKGPAANMMRSLGYPVSALGVATVYGDLLDGFVIDDQDAGLAPEIGQTGPRVLVTQTIMSGPDDRARLAREITGWATEFAAGRQLV